MSSIIWAKVTLNDAYDIAMAAHPQLAKEINAKIDKEVELMLAKIYAHHAQTVDTPLMQYGMLYNFQGAKTYLQQIVWC